jgi:hypothetical protein
MVRFTSFLPAGPKAAWAGYYRMAIAILAPFLSHETAIARRRSRRDCILRVQPARI